MTHDRRPQLWYDRVFRALMSVVAVCLVALDASAIAQESAADKVILQPKNSSSRIAFTCVVVDFTGEKLTIRSRESTLIKTYDASEVVEIQTPQTERHVKGLASLAEGDVAQAALSFEIALAEESREWVRRDILAMLVRCALRQGDYVSAGAKFLALWESDPTTQHFKLAPLTWSAGNLSDALRGQSRGWISRNTEMSRLLGASHLLTDGQNGALARNEMTELAASVDERIRLLARAQLWRLRLREEDISPAEIKRWQARIEALPEGIRGGPWYVLGQGHLIRKEYDRAAVALLWVPLVYDHDTYLAARACLEAADALSKAGQARESVALYREVTTRFASTPYADEAAALMKSQAAESGGTN